MLMTNSRNTTNTTASTPPTLRRGKSANQPVATHTVQKPNASRDSKETKWVQIRLIPIWLRVLIIFILLLIAVVAGLTIGYSVLGDGDSSEVLEWSTWQHLIDIIKGKE